MFLRNKFFLILQFLGNILLDFLGRIYFPSLILHTNWFYLFELDLPIGSIVVAEIVEIRIPGWCHEEQYPNSYFSNISASTSATASYNFAEPFSLFGRPIQPFAQDFCGNFACLSTFAQRFGLDLSSHKFPWCQADVQQNRNPPTVSWAYEPSP